MATAIAQTLVGQMLMERYLLLEHLEVGGFSQTYLVIDTERPEAPCRLLKILDHQLNPELDVCSLHHFFEAEAHALGRLGAMQPIGMDHLPVPKLMTYCRDRSQIYLVQEFIEGERLDYWMHRTPRPQLKQIIQLLAEILLILHQVHTQGIIHCDLKPSNLIRRKSDGKLILIDFGACYLHGFKVLGVKVPTIPSSVSHGNHKEYVLGTPGYMPEEQVAGMPQFNSDLYALGMMIIQIITGVAPQDLQPHLIVPSWQWVQYLDKPFSTSKLIPILDRMVRINHHDRYQNVSEVMLALEALLPSAQAARMPNIQMDFRRTAPLPTAQQPIPQHKTVPTIRKMFRYSTPIADVIPPTRSFKIIAS